MSAGHGPEASGDARSLEGEDEGEDEVGVEGDGEGDGEGEGEADVEVDVDAPPLSVDARLHAHTAIATKPERRTRRMSPCGVERLGACALVLDRA